MQSIIRSSSNRVREQRATSEKARSRKFAIKLGWAIVIVVLMAVFVLVNITMLQTFKEQPVYGFQRDERHALGVGPLLADMLKRRGFHKQHVKQQPSKKVAVPSLASNASVPPSEALALDMASNGSDVDGLKSTDEEPLKDDPLATADEKLEASLKEGSATPDASTDGLDAEILAAAGGDADLALAAEAEADSQEAVTDQSYTAEAAKLEAELEKEFAKGGGAKLRGTAAKPSSTTATDEESRRLAREMDKYIQDEAKLPATGNTSRSVSA